MLRKKTQTLILPLQGTRTQGQWSSPTWSCFPPSSSRACGPAVPREAHVHFMILPSSLSRAWEWAGSQKLWSHLPSLSNIDFASRPMDGQDGKLHTGSKVKLLDRVQGISALGTKRSKDAGQGVRWGWGWREQGPGSHGWCREASPSAHWEGGWVA